MTRTRRIASSYRALLEVSFEYVASGESVVAQPARVRSLASVCPRISGAGGQFIESLTSQHVPFQMLGM